MQKYNEQKRLLSQPGGMLISNLELINGTIVTPLLLFYWELGFACTIFFQFVEFTAVKCFDDFLQPDDSGRRQGDKNPNSGVGAETIRMPANSSYVYQNSNGSRHPLTKYTNDGETHAAIQNKMFNRLGNNHGQFYEVKLAKSDIEYDEPVIAGDFILQYAWLRKLELYYNPFTNFL